MKINIQQGFCLLENVAALTMGAALTLLLLAILCSMIRQHDVINANLTNTRQTLMLYQILKNNIQPNPNQHCKTMGSNNIATGNDILNITCCKNNICDTKKIYLSNTKTLLESTKSSNKEQILRNICKFSIRYGIISNKKINYYRHNGITNWHDIATIKASVSICSQSFSTNMEFAL